jgi:hypothetical protein
VSSAAHVGLPGAMGKEREGERRLVGGPAREMGPICQGNEESVREAGRWARQQVLIKFKIVQTVRT